MFASLSASRQWGSCSKLACNTGGNTTRVKAGTGDTKRFPGGLEPIIDSNKTGLHHGLVQRAHWRQTGNCFAHRLAAEGYTVSKDMCCSSHLDAPSQVLVFQLTIRPGMQA
jgi:hypothetical protein